jgi:drug/metabolite transporter (DMT)-like permease
MKERGDHMKLDDLKAAWREEIAQSVRTEDLPMTAIMSDVKKINREVGFRDFWMIFALAMGALEYLIFGWLIRENVDSLSRLGVLVFIAAAAVMSVALIRARSVTRSDDWTLRFRIEVEIEKLQKQEKLMNRVGYWFLLPMLIANGISLLGGHHARTGSLLPDTPELLIFASCGLVYGLTYWLVRREVKRKWSPVLARLRRLHTDLLGETG